MTDQQKRWIEDKEKNDSLYGYEKDKVAKAFDRGVTVEDMDCLWNGCKDILTLRVAVGALAKGLGMPYAEYFVRNENDLGYTEMEEVLRSFEQGVTLEQALKYFSKEHKDGRIAGMCELLLSTSEEDAAPYLTQPFRMRQFQSIAHGFRRGYTNEQITMYAKPEVRANTMQIICNLIDDGHGDMDVLKIILCQPWKNLQLDRLVDAIYDHVPTSVLKLAANRKYTGYKRLLIMQGYKEGLPMEDLMKLADEANYNVESLYKKLLEAKEHKPAASSATYEDLVENIRKMVFTAEQKKELTELILFGDA